MTIPQPQATFLASLMLSVVRLPGGHTGVETWLLTSLNLAQGFSYEVCA